MAEASGDGSMEDRISALPDELLIHVLSHLRSRKAVQTCVLARRWRYLWRSVTCIDVSFEEFEDRAAANDLEREEVFKMFVNHLLILRERVDLKEFHLQYSLVVGVGCLSAKSDEANLWIRHALQYKAQTVKIGNHSEPLQLLPSVFTSTYLKRLHITNAQLILGFFDRLRKGCPALEYLFLSTCDIEDLDIFSDTLKVLILSDAIGFSFSFEHDAQVSISAPSLISLSVKECPSGARLPILKNMSSLETASVLLSEGDITTCDADGIRQFLGGLSGVRSLDFYYGDRQLEVKNNHGWCPTFNNLTNLTLDRWCMHADLYAMIVFLQNSPNLKKLTLKLNEPRYHNEVVSAVIGELEDRSFTCEQLEIVEIICSKGNELLLLGLNQFLLEESGIRPDQMRVSHQN
ncbi:putative F-box/FBD/LRR-repeat protein At1g78760 [Aegilops tauschii subsp. strangulata]|nr:F-box/FBD/LRR-repeat protein At2g26030 [Aegilops tauschii subsp. strangulata]